MIQYAEVAINIPFEYDSLLYKIPYTMEGLEKGMRVEVPLRSRILEGVVIGISNAEPNYETKPIHKKIDKFPVINEDQIRLAYWMKDYYLASLGECLNKMIPDGKRRKLSADKTLTNKPSLLKLNTEQENAFQSIKKQFGKESVHLLYGITGSGKTEVYIHLLKSLLEETDKSAIFLVPEISLTVQTLRRLEAIFGNLLAIFHSALKVSDKYNNYLSILKNEKRIIVGTRSAIFAPIEKLGLVIIDEEHDSSYKEHSTPRYHARQIAMQRCKTHQSVLVLGSATPSVEVFFNATKENIHLHKLTKRANPSASLSNIILYEQKGSDVLGQELLFKIKQRLDKNEQTILLLNRRGHSPMVYSRKNKQFIQCPNCTTNLCFHKKGNVICHLCGHSESLSKVKKRMGDEEIEMFGSGTQKLEEFLLETYPSAKIERLDQDVSKNKELLTEVIGRLIDGEIDILTGTQMISKGLDASKVTLVGVVNASIGLGLPDFRAGERVYSLLTQVAGRAGRSELKGEVVIEATNTNHPIVQLATKQNYEEFYKSEIHVRYFTNYPPYSRLIRLLVRSHFEDKSMTCCELVKNTLDKFTQELLETKTEILGPAPCPIYKMDKNYRNHILIKTNSPSKVKKLILEKIKTLKLPNTVYLEIDIDPIDLL